MIRCPNCRRIYDPNKSIADMGIPIVTVLGEARYFDICKYCRRHPKRIDIVNVVENHRKLRTPEYVITEGLKFLEKLKRGEITYDI